MNTDKELFKKALIEAEKEILNPDEISRTKWEFSDSFEHKMQNLIETGEKNQSKSRMKKFSVSLIAAVMAVVILFSGVMTVMGTRASKIDLDVYEEADYYEVRLNPESKYTLDKIETYYTLSQKNLPDGYRLENAEYTEMSNVIVWENPNGNKIEFHQKLIDEYEKISKDEFLEKKTKNGLPMFVYCCSAEADGKSFADIRWYDDSYCYELIATGGVWNAQEMKESVKLLTALSDKMIKCKF